MSEPKCNHAGQVQVTDNFATDGTLEVCTVCDKMYVDAQPTEPSALAMAIFDAMNPHDPWDGLFGTSKAAWERVRKESALKLDASGLLSGAELGAAVSILRMTCDEFFAGGSHEASECLGNYDSGWTSECLFGKSPSEILSDVKGYFGGTRNYDGCDDEQIDRDKAFRKRINAAIDKVEKQS